VSGPRRFKLAQQAPSAIAAAPKLTLDHRRGTAHQRGYGRAWQRISIRYRRLHPFCEWCLQEGREALTALVDHMIPVVDRPELLLEWENLFALCPICHGRKFSLELYARNHGLIDHLPAWCKDPTQRPARFGPAVRTG
jgi:5-methylcytosine-specific restriction endonuclease McrA